jgi:hypothetical protein
MIDERINNLTSEIAGKERQIVDDFCKAFIAQKSLDGETAKYVLENYRLCVMHDFTKDVCSKYWFEPKHEQ